MELSYSLDLSDYEVAEKLAAEHFRSLLGPPIRSFFLNLATWIFVGAGVMAALDDFERNSRWYASTTFVIGVCVVFGMGLHFAFRAHNRKVIRSFRIAALEPFPIECRLSLSEAGIDTESRLGRAFVPWDRVTGANSHPNHIAIHLRQGQVLVVPKRSFASQDDSGQLVAIIRAHVET